MRLSLPLSQAFTGKAEADGAPTRLPALWFWLSLLLRFFRHAKILRKCAKDFPAFASSALLLKAWAKRRALLASGASSLPSGRQRLLV